jgi:Zn-dependent protease with chaperone function
MDFFQSQDIARRNTKRLVFLFALALLSLIAMTNLLILFGLGVFADTLDTPLFERIDWSLFASISLAILVVVAGGSFYKLMSLRGGGASVAEMMKGRLIVAGSQNLAEQKVLNVVEEMAIASGTPVPPVYVIEEQSINAFAAGFTPADAVIGITRGAIESFSREELQGVIAHEFSHILHGDMRLNIRLIGILYGIMVLGIVGYYIVRSTGMSRRSKNSGNIAIAGIGLIVLGYSGTFFGNWIKAAVSRQREFLADASAVQFTRNPDGIADALKRIGSSATGSVMESPGASEISHALFGEGVKHSFSSMFATHPPLAERIKRVQPNWDGSFDLPIKTEQKASSEKGANAGKSRVSGVEALTTAAIAHALLAQAGNPSETDLDEAQKAIAAIPEVLMNAAHDPFSARAVVYFLLIDQNKEIASQQFAALEAHADTEVFKTLQLIHDDVGVVEPTLRLTLINLCLPVLRQLTPKQYEVFRQNLDTLIIADGKTSLWEWVLQRVVLHQLDAVFRPKGAFSRVGKHSLKNLSTSCACVLSFLARSGQQSEQDGLTAFSAGAKALGIGELTYPAGNELSIEKVNVSLSNLASLKPLQKPAFLKACAACIAADGEAYFQELEIFRAIAAVIDCPLPPIPLHRQPD